MSDSSKTVVIAIAIVLGAFFLLPAFMGLGMMGMFPFGGMMGAMMGWGPSVGWGWVFPLVLWGGIITTIVFLVRGVTRGGGGTSYHGEDTALDILKKRYARGEITREEFQERRRALTELWGSGPASWDGGEKR
jgi:putative membrane protein